MLWECLLHMLQDRQKKSIERSQDPVFRLSGPGCVVSFAQATAPATGWNRFFLFGGDGWYLEWRCFLMEQKSRNV